MSSSPSAKAAQQIYAEYCATQEHEPVREAVEAELRIIIQQAISASLRARDAEIEGLIAELRVQQKEYAAVTAGSAFKICADRLSALITKEQPKS